MSNKQKNGINEWKIIKERVEPVKKTIWHTSPTNRLSSSFSEQAMLKDWIKSLQFPYFGIVMVHGNGFALPSELKTVKVIDRIDVVGRGNDKYINGSNVTDNLLQAGHTSFDLYWPCQKNDKHKFLFKACLI